ncbi:hypothetical protein AUJ16_02940 [Candidatus Micrarchaeota archaeon CG1_02_60_51]|nr:MAG: hypothetical protein AUJ16_02940 [Candidatus Micrarchaeota archaeon CG1_02_60_51]
MFGETEELARDLRELKKAVVEREQEVDLKGIVKRLRRGSDERVKHEPSSRVSAIASSLTGESYGESPDFEKTDLSEIKTGPMALPASFYSVFKGPLNALASTLAGIPALQGLRNLLDSAGIMLSIESYLTLVASSAVLAAVACFVLFGALGAAFGDSLLLLLAPVAGVAAFAMVIVAAMAYPASKADSRARDIDRVLPFALRQLATQIKAGVSFYRALRSVAQSDYGVLSEELNRVLGDMANGLSTEDALSKLLRRTRSKGLRKALTQIVRALKTGGSLSQIITDIADDVSFETRMSIRDFTERLNFINIIYIMVAVVAPVGAAILSAVMQIPLFGGGLPPFFVYGAFGGIIAAMFAILYITKRLEPVAW